MATDPKKQFEGEFLKVDGDRVTVKLANGKQFTFKKSAVTAEDQKFIAEKASNEEAAAEPSKGAESAPAQKADAK